MPRKRITRDPSNDTGTVTQQDDADILEEVGVTPDEEGRMTVSEDRLREVGAVDAESIRANNRAAAFVDKKRGNVSNVSFSSDDVLERYETALKAWPANTLDITIIRRTGTPVQHTIRTRPRSGAELYEAIYKLHGQFEEAEYEVRCFDTNSKQYRMSGGRIVMPDTRSTGTQGGQPQMPQQAPPPYYPPTNYPVAPQAPAAAVAPQNQNDPMAVMDQMFQLFQRMQSQAQAQVPAPPAYAPPPPQPLPQFSPPPMPPADASMETMLAWMQRVYDMVQRMQTPLAPARVEAPAPQQPQANPMGMPPVQPPPGMMFVPGFGYVPVDRLMQALGAPAPQPAAPPRGPMFRDPQQYRPGPYAPQDGSPQQQRSYSPPSQQPQQPPSITQQFRESMGVVRMARQMLDEVGELVPGHDEGMQMPEPEVDDDSPVRFVKAGEAQIAFDKENGKFRFWETGFANADKIFKFVGEVGEKIQEAQNKRQQQLPQQQQRRVLPPGYVEVGPGYQPPAGYVAVEVEPEEPYRQPAPQRQQQQPPLAPPPEFVPPPVQQTVWGTPPTSTEEQVP